jgi:ABC-type lipoprotein release transport system permease subunit
MLRHLFKIAVRSLWKHRGYSVINVAGLAMGMAFAILILLWVRFEVQFDRYHENVDRLHLVAFKARDDSFFGDQTVGATAKHLREEYPEVTHATRVSTISWRRLQHEGTKFVAGGRYVDPDFLRMFTIPLLRGEAETALAEPHSIAITERLANRIFGDEDPIGKALRFGEELDLTVTAVLEDPPANTRFRTEFLVNAKIGSPIFERWDIKCLQTFVMLAEGVDHEAFNPKIRDIFNDRLLQELENDYYLVPLDRIHLYNLEGGGAIVYVMVFTGIAIAILLMACINFVNLSTARAEIRYKEIGVKKAIGAGRGQLAAQFLGESVLISLTALVIAVALVEWMVPVLNAILRLRLQLDFSLSTILGLLGIALGTGVVAGVYPALYLSSLRPLAVLRTRQAVRARPRWRIGRLLGGGTRGTALRRALVVVQFTLSAVFMICVLFIFLQVHHVKNMDVGFDPEHVVVFGLPGELVPRAEVVKNELLKSPNVESVTVSSASLMRWQTSFGIDWDGKPELPPFDVGYNEVDYDYAETFRMEMVHGRFFSREFASDTQGAFVVNEALTRAMRMENPVGLEVVGAGGSPIEQRGTIVGVIRDFHTESAHKEIRPFMLGLTKTGYRMCVRMVPGTTPDTLKHIRATLKQFQPDADPTFWFYRDAVVELYTAEIFTGTVIIIIAGIAIMISCLGLLGLAAYLARQRTKETGIRKVLGASVWNIVVLFVRETSLLVLLAGLIGIPIAYAIMRSWLERFAFRIELSVWPFILVTLITLAIALLTVGLQALRAARANPVDAIRYE